MKITKTGLALLLATFFLIAAVAIPLTASNFSGVHIDQLPQGGTATPRLVADNLNGPSVIAEFRDNRTPVARFPDGGGFSLLSGNITLSGGNFPLGYASSAQEIACFTSLVTGTRILTATGLSTATFALATLITDPGAGAGDPFTVSADAPTTETVTINVWQDDASAAATVATVHWCAVGDE